MINGAGQYIARAAARHVAFVVVEELLQQTGPGVRIALSVDRVVEAEFVTFTARAELAAADA